MKLSVMMITYNHERFIAQALESILAQKVDFDYEIVVGEDCSTDRTRDILVDFQRRYPGKIVSLLRDQNVGPMANLEATLAACRGQYVGLLEGDDYWTCEHKLQRQVDYLDAHPDYAICCHRVQVLDEMDTSQAGVLPPRPPGSYTLEDLLQGNFIMTCTVVYRRNPSGELPSWFHQVKPGDWPLMALAARFGKINLMDEVMAVYRVHSGGTWSARPRSGQLRECIPMLEALDEQLGFRYTNIIRRTIAQFYFNLAINARADGNRRETAKHLVNCVRNGRPRLPGSEWAMAGLAAYILMGSWYRIFSKGKQTNPA
jgi:glycosyltransferase involved in cell wall biosynthesis